MKIISWNVNGIRAVSRKGFVDWAEDYRPDILCLQETKANLSQIEKKHKELLNINEYKTFWNSSEVKKGYSGVVTYTIPEPLNTSISINKDEFDQEGRVVMTEYDGFMLFNVYFPNGQVSKGDKESDSDDAKKRLGRLDYKLRFYDYFLDYIENLRKDGKKIIVCGDYNTAHTEIDLARPKQNEENTGFLPEERAWMDKLVDRGYIDTFRKLHPGEKDHYTWWSYRGGARKRNVGWRIDYVFISPDLEPALKDAFILSDVEGSDHCPHGIEIDINKLADTPQQ